MTHTTFFETRTWTGSGEGRINEDYAVIRTDARCAVLVDGATGLTKVNLVAGETDASWYARELAQQTAALLEDPAMPAARALAQAGTAVAEEYLHMPGSSALGREDLPNGSVAILRWSEDKLEVTMLGDCTAVVTLADGSARLVHDATLDELDRQNYERMFCYATQNNATMAQARKALNDRFIENRLKMNEPGGYWAADATCRGFGHELVERFPMAQVTGAFACSDGFVAAVEMGVTADETSLAQDVLAGKGEQVARALRDAEQADRDLMRVHRSKISDDATYIAIAFEQ
ncbi:MAG: hypothetical protein Q4A01_04955 [Coriobacteriales bacterium]|nr:hypothetical protein [Coriobacteriales bacterium]